MLTNHIGLSMLKYISLLFTLQCKPLAELFEMIANNEETSSTCVQLLLNNNALKQNDFPQQLNLNVATIIGKMVEC